MTYLQSSALAIAMVVSMTATAAPATPTSAAAAVAADGHIRMIVAFRPGAAAQIRAAVAAARGNVKLDIAGMDAIAVELPARAAALLQARPDVLYVEQDVKRYPLALATPSAPPYQAGQLVPYGIPMVQADQLPDTYSANRTVCIIDSGVDRSHPDLYGNQFSGQYDSGTGWWYTDENDHGTHVTGTIAALDNSGVGVVGIHPHQRLKLRIVKVFGADGWAYSSTLASAANQCGANGANVISMSLGGSFPSFTELRAFDGLASRGVLSVAASGNAGNTTLSYPAGYASVLSVAALDEHRNWASFSQYNTKVELAAPGVGVLSTVPVGAGVESALVVGGRTYVPGTLEGSPRVTVTAPLADFGLGDSTNSAMAGKVCLIARGSVNFSVKVANCESSGGVGAVIYNNAPGGFSGTLGTSAPSIPAVTASDTEGAALRGQLGQSATVAVRASNYAYFDGTSMATPHVAGVAALVWSYYPSCTGAQIRNSLDKSALDLGSPGRDTRFGYGLVQARAAYDRIKSLGCGN